MKNIKRLAFIGNSLPRRCGIATFTTDIFNAVSGCSQSRENTIVAMSDHGQVYDYPSSVGLEIKDNRIEDYLRAADFLNEGNYAAVSLQHEFGIFGGEAGCHILSLLRQLTMPVVTTLHTVLRTPDAKQRKTLEQIVDASAKVIVMAEKGREMLQTLYHVPAQKIEVIPHGIPDVPYVNPLKAKEILGFGDRTIILTFGLLSPNKGIEVMIDAMPSILKSRPDCLYVVLGATHPNLKLVEGEAYREKLQNRVQELGVENHVVFLDQFADTATLLNMISMCDVYVTPYLDEAQMTSGTLAYSYGLGKAVVSTPYWHARELLADGRGVLIPFGDVEATAREVSALLVDDARREAMQRRAYEESRAMTWSKTGENYLKLIESVCMSERVRKVTGNVQSPVKRGNSMLPEMKMTHLQNMCDSTGLYQHAIFSIPDRSHGYCIDDNARALLLATFLNTSGEAGIDEKLTTSFASFIQHAWNPDNKRFRNFMSFDRSWLDEGGSEDSHGRTIWALGYCFQKDRSPSRREWAKTLFCDGLVATKSFISPRAWAFVLLGLDCYCQAEPSDQDARELMSFFADKLMAILSATETHDWVWFEETLSYDNARLPQALIVTGLVLDNDAYTSTGLKTLDWLMKMQTTPAGCFRAIGTESFGAKRTDPELFDQQPLEAAATISACFAAWRVDGTMRWKADADRAFSWFLGRNDLSVALVDIESGSCRDGLHNDRPNENRGGESVVSYLLGLAEIRQLARLSEGGTKAASRLA